VHVHDTLKNVKIRLCADSVVKTVVKVNIQCQISYKA